MTLRLETTPIAELPPIDIEHLVARRTAVTIDPGLGAAFIAEGEARHNLDRLVAGRALCVTTGQQPGLFTGPLFTVYKALSAVALAHRLQRELGRPVVPIFWVAGDDHDLAEANHITVATLDNEIRPIVLRLPDPAAQLTPLYKERLGPELSAARNALLQTTPESEFRPDVMAWLDRHYRPDATFADAFAGAVADLLGRHGLVVFRSTHVAAKRVMRPLFIETLQRAGALHRALQARAGELERDGRPVPVHVGDAAIPMMIEASQGRDRLVWEGNAFHARRSHERWTLAELEREVGESPQRFSPNVLLRPVVEAAIFPTLAYVAGPGELAYLPQCKPLYQELGVTPQLPIPRWSGRIVESRITKVLKKYSLTPQDLSGPEGHVESALAREDMPGEAAEALSALRSTIQQEYERIERVAGTLDPTLRKSVRSARNTSLGEAAHVEKRIVSHLKSHNKILIQQIGKARHSLFPLGRPQERVFNIVPYLIRYGTALVDDMLASCQAWYDGAADRTGDR